MDFVSRSSTPIVDVTEHWVSALPASVALDAIVQAFSDLGAKVQRSSDRIEVRAGSNWKYRVLGNLLASGKTLPVALDVTAASSGKGSAVHAHAFDTFGFHVPEQTFFGAKESFEGRLEELLTTAAAAARVANRAEGAI